MSSTINDSGYNDFRVMAADPSLSKYEKIGFPNSYRQGFEELIFRDIMTKVTNAAKPNINILDIGPGCSDLPHMIINLSASLQQNLVLIDSEEMLSLLPSSVNIEKISGAFPNIDGFVEHNKGKFDVIICYSVVQYIFVEFSLFKFLDSAMSLLGSGGQMLIGDIPNVSKRKRFFASETGRRFHKEFMQTVSDPEVRFNQIEFDKIDDSVIMAIVQRARSQGFDAYVLPQISSLPMANRREDILIINP